ncbi:MAG: nuclear transport factor 2 family protein [Actinomycetota bacterium]
MQLSADDRLDIHELPARYADALDLLEPERLHHVFTDDAIWEIPARSMQLVGIDEIKGFMGRPDVHPGAHLMTNVYIVSVAEGPDGPVVHLRSRGIFPVGPSDPRQPTEVFYGRYDDDVVRSDAGWRIRHRRYAFGS